MPAVCQQQPAGGELHLAICSSPRKLHVYESEGENVQFYTSQPARNCLKLKHNIPPLPIPHSRSIDTL